MDGEKSAFERLKQRLDLWLPIFSLAHLLVVNWMSGGTACVLTLDITFLISFCLQQWFSGLTSEFIMEHVNINVFFDRANIIKVWSSNDKRETKWKKANNSSTNYKNSSLRSSVLFDKPDLFFLDNSKEYFWRPVLSFMSVKKRPVNWPWFTQWWQWRNRGKNTCLKAHGTEPN